MREFESDLWNTGFRTIAGIDEAGRGSLAGPVVAAAVIFEPGCDIEGINDSKKLTPKIRESLYDDIVRYARAVGVGIIDQKTIDSINILQATFLAMQKAVSNLPERPDYLLIDGNQAPVFNMPFKVIVKGDSRSFSIAAASIIAKVTRDRIMIELDRDYPEYRFCTNKGYATSDHIDAIKENGLTKEHRYTFCRKFNTPQISIF